MAIDVTNEQLSDLLEKTRIWLLERDINELYASIIKDAVQLMRMERGAIFLTSESGLTIRAAWPSDNPLLASGSALRMVLSVMQQNRPLLAQSVESDALHGVVCCIPLSTSTLGVLGAIVLETMDSSMLLSSQSMNMSELLGLQAAVALENTTLFHSAITDPLTGLITHRHFQYEIEQVIRRAVRSGQPVTLAILDLDHFKQLNDQYGHAEGNRCLLQVSHLLRTLLRGSDIIGRFGGDEFELLLLDTPPQSAVHVLEKVCAHLAILPNTPVTMTASIGIAAYPDHAESGESLFLLADEMLYRAKEEGRNRVVVATSPVPMVDAPAGRMRGTRMKPKPINAPIPSPVEQYIDGHRIVRRLGAGKSGEVLLVHQPELDREVALKRLLSARLSAEKIQQFEQEVKVTARLNHPGVVPVYTLGRDTDARRYFTMRPLSGVTLETLMREQIHHTPPSRRLQYLPRLFDVVLRAAETIAYAHTQATFHLDLNPGNIMVGEFGEVIVIDWGMSQSSRSPHQRDSAAGESRFIVHHYNSYMAPEQALGSAKTAGAAADVYALGALLYELMTGVVPVYQDTIRAEGNIPPPEHVAPEIGIDPGIATLCMLALSRDPACRPSAAEFAARLGKYLRGEVNVTTMQFDPAMHPLRDDEWLMPDGAEPGDAWHHDEMSWVSRGNAAYLCWREPLPGACRFVCEVWAETEGNIALLLRTQLTEGRLVEGYKFELGAEYNTCCKLDGPWLHMSTSTLLLEPQRRYRLDIAYQDKWIRCSIDDQVVFEHRELFSTFGQYLALYAAEPGMHFRPLILERELRHTRISIVEMADSYYLDQHIAQALKIYHEVAEQLGDHSEGLECLLKMGFCYARLGQYDAAKQAFNRLDHTILEPYARYEMAIAEYLRDDATTRKHGMKLLEATIKRFPNHAATSRLKSIALLNELSLLPRGAKYADRLRSFSHLLLLVLQTSGVRGSTQYNILRNYLHSLMLLGEWDRLIHDTPGLLASLPPQYPRFPDADNFRLLPALCGMEDHLLPHDPFLLNSWGTMFASADISPVTLPTHIAARHRGLEWFLYELLAGRGPSVADASAAPMMAFVRFEVLVATGHFAEADRWVRTPAATGLVCDWVNEVCLVVIHSTRQDLLEEVFAFYRQVNPLADSSLNLTYCRLLTAIYQGDWETAACCFHDEQEFISPRMDDTNHRLLFRVLLASLGYKQVAPSSGALRRAVTANLTGPLLHLAQIFAGHTEPQPDASWPRPCWRPEYRLWLALWLEAKGQYTQARAIAEPALDPRYGEINAQPLLRKLLARL